MKSKAIFIYISMLIYGVISQSCTDNGCGGPYADKYKITDFEVSLNELKNSDDPFLGSNAIENSKVHYNSFAIEFKGVTENYFSSTFSLPKLGIISTAYACSPVPPSTVEKVTDIRVFCDQTIIDSYPENTNIASLFDIVYLQDLSEMKQEPLENFLAIEQTAVTNFTLILNIQPAQQNTYIFRVEYEQDGIDMDSFSFTSESVTITVD